MRCMRSTARDSFEACFGGAFALPILFPRRRFAGRGDLLVAAARVAVEGTRRRKLAELVADHLFRDVDRNEALAVVDLEGQADEIGQDRRAARPGLVRRRTWGALRDFC